MSTLGIVSATSAGTCVIDLNQSGNANYSAAAQVVVTATFTASGTTVTVIFNGGDGGTGSMANETFTVGVPKALSANGFVRPGYTFSYWDTDLDANTPGNVAYAPGQVVTLSAGTTLYAQWTKNP